MIIIIYNDLTFLPERMKIEKFENLVANVHDKHIGNAKKHEIID